MEGAAGVVVREAAAEAAAATLVASVGATAVWVEELWAQVATLGACAPETKVAGWVAEVGWVVHAQG